MPLTDKVIYQCDHPLNDQDFCSALDDPDKMSHCDTCNNIVCGNHILVFTMTVHNSIRLRICTICQAMIRDHKMGQTNFS